MWGSTLTCNASYPRIFGVGCSGTCTALSVWQLGFRTCSVDCCCSTRMLVRRSSQPGSVGWWLRLGLRSEFGDRAAESASTRYGDEGDRGHHEEGRRRVVDQEPDDDCYDEATQVAGHPDEAGRGSFGFAGTAFYELEDDR